jgi:hypothetical protein
MTTASDVECDLRIASSLDGTWEFVTDPNESGVEAGWYESDAEWPDRTRSVEVPRAWEEIERFRGYAGTVWYRRTVTVDGEDLDGRDAVLRFEAVDYETTAWVNGRRVGSNRGGYLPFEFDATETFSPGENAVVVSVTDPANLAEIPHGKQGDPWYTRVSGIWQSVSLSLRPPTRIGAVRATPDLTTDHADVEVDVVGRSAAGDTLRCEIRASRDGEGAATATVPAADTAEAVLELEEPAYWTPSSPALYDLDVRLVDADGEVVDRVTDYFGMRRFEARDGAFYLNGEPIRLRGVLEQGYYPKTLYRPPDGDTYADEVTVAKDLGFNLIRKHLKPAHPDFLEEADRRGLLVWEEPANPTRFTQRSKEEVRAQLEGLVERDYNRPSVVIWSLYNEEWGIGHHDSEETLWTDEEKQAFLSNLYRETRQRDVTRVVCDNSGWAHVETDVNDFHRYFPSPDRAEAWEADVTHICHHPGDNYATTEYDDADAPIVVSELGSWGLGDVSALRDAYDGDPPWFSHDFLTDPLKRPDGLDDRFDESDLSEVFGGMAELETAWQRREFVSVKHVIEQMRRRERIAGYVLTELSDIEWEFNGVLDYLREEKAFHDEFRAVNRAVSLVVEPDRRAVRAGESVAFDAYVVNDTGDSLSGTVEWTLGGESAPTVEPGPVSTPVTVDPHSVRRVALGADAAVTLTASAAVETVELRVTARFSDRTVSTAEPLTAVDDADRGPPDATVFAEGAFASRLASRGVDVTHELGEGVDVAFAERFTPEIDQFATNGGAVVHVPTDDGEMVAGGPFSYRRVPEEESWVGVASFFYQDSPLLSDLCDGARLGWAFEGLYPHAVATDLDPSVDRVHAGYVEGWLANWGSPLVVCGQGAGSVTSCTFRVRDAYGTNPVATLLCDRLIRWLSD